MALTLVRTAPAPAVSRSGIRLGLTVFGLCVPLAAFAFLLANPEYDATYGSGPSHFYIVSLAAGIALTLAIAVIWAARRLPDSRTFFLAMAFVSMSTIFLAHGLGTSPWFGGHGGHGDVDPFLAYGAASAEAGNDEKAYSSSAKPRAA